jgi:hypothetical protein
LFLLVSFAPVLEINRERLIIFQDTYSGFILQLNRIEHQPSAEFLLSKHYEFDLELTEKMLFKNIKYFDLSKVSTGHWQNTIISRCFNVQEINS